MKRSYRVGLIYFSHESNTFAPGRTELRHFKQAAFHCGDDILAYYQNGNSAIAGFLEVLSAANLEVVPLVAVGATPGPIVSDETLQQIWQVIEAELQKAGPLDGVLVAPHGAGVSEKKHDMDGWWLGRLREVVGPSVPIIGPIDPHANLTSAMLTATTALLPFKTNPHLDAKERGRKAAQLMVQTLRGEVHPVQKYCAPPLLINIEKQHSETAPLSELYELCTRAESRPGILDISVLLGFPYADVPEMNSGILVISDGDAELATNTALELGQKMWEMRDEFLPSLLAPEAAIEQVKTSDRPVCLLDMGDNIGGGGTGEGTWLLHILAQQPQLNFFFCLYDPDVVQLALEAGIDARVKMKIGGRTLPERDGQPYEFSGVVKAFPPTQFEDPQVRHGGRRIFKTGACVLLQSEDERISLLVTSKRISPNSPEMIPHCGLSAANFDVIVAKGVNAPLGAFNEVCPTFIKVNTPGVTSADFAHFTFHHRRQPLFPFEQTFDSPTLECCE